MIAPAVDVGGGWRGAAWRSVGRRVFRWTIQNQYGLRRRILRVFGARIGARTKFRPTVNIERPWLVEAGDLTIFGDNAQLVGKGPIRVGERCVVSQHVILATTELEPRPRTDADPRRMFGEWRERTAPIVMEDDTWVAADSLVRAGAVVRAGTVVGARSLVEGVLPGWMIATGEPAEARRPRKFGG